MFNYNEKMLESLFDIANDNCVAMAKCNCTACNSCSCGRCYGDDCISQCSGCKSSGFVMTDAIWDNI